MRIMGIPVVGTLVAGLVIFFVGFLWYGVLFQEAWMAGEGLTEASFEGDSPWWMLLGFVIAMGIAKGIAFVLSWRGWPSLSQSVFTALMLALTIGGAMSAYDWAYLPSHNFTLFLINWSYAIVGWSLAGAVLSKLNKI